MHNTGIPEIFKVNFPRERRLSRKDFLIHLDCKCYEYFPVYGQLRFTQKFFELPKRLDNPGLIWI